MKCGLELHMQVNTGKLFCRCPNKIIKDEKPDYVIKRKLHAVAGETGKIDIAAKKEEEKNKIIKYNCYNENVCLVDLDEEPPKDVNEKAFKAALEIALLLNMRPVDEFHIMRKLIIDGSTVTGFQRTGLLARNGYLKTSQGKVRIITLSLEEDSAKRIDDNTFSLDRLGIPLIEIVTAPDIKTPLHAKEVAEKIGNLAKFTGKLMRGIGTIRQDVNVSVKGGARCEIKGVQDLRLMPKFVELEGERQLKLIELKNQLKNKKVNMNEPVEVTRVFKKTKCHFLKNKTIHGIRVRNAKGLLGYKLQLDKTFGKDIAEHLKVYTGIKGVLHRDELPNYGVTEKEVKSIIKELKCNKEDNFLVIACSKEQIRKLYKIIKERIKQAKKGVKKEVRAPNHANGTTTFLRPLPTGSRMYPETDVKVIRLKHELISRIIENLSKTPEQQYELLKSMGLNDELANQMLNSKKLDLFEKVTDKTNADNKLTATLLLENPVLKIEEEKIIKLFKLLEENKITKDAVPKVMKRLRKEKLEKIIKDYKPLTTKELTQKIKNVIKQNKKIIKHPSSFGVIMRELLKEINGRADAGLISALLRKEMGKEEIL